MKYLHPASLILLGLAFLIAASTRDGRWLFIAGTVATTGAAIAARRNLAAILRRSRWLFLAMLVMFGWMTPGTPISWLPLASTEGLYLAAENVSRLLIAIATVAILLTVLRPVELVHGVRALLAPIAPLGGFRDRLAVRLMLTLQHMEEGAGVSGATEKVVLPETAMGIRDALAISCSAGLLLTAAFL